MDHHHRHRDNTPEHGSNPNSRAKPQRKNIGTPGDNESYNKKTTEVSAGDVFPEENPEAYDSQGSNDARRKGELNHAILVKLQEISQYNIEIGNYDEGLANYDRCIDHLLRTLPQGPSASMFKDFLIKTVKYLNEVALKLLQEEKVKDSLLLLERCRKMTHPNSFGPYPTLRSLTYNHLGCCYRRIGKLDKAVYYLEKAWEFIQDIERVETSGITHINLCAVLSQLGDHKRALEHATMAVSDCSFDLIEATKKNAESGDPKANVHKQATMLAIAYHNLATEEEACKNGEAALQAYLRAYNLIREHNHPQHELCQKFGRAYEEARARISKPGFNKRAASPGEAARRYGTSPPGSRQVVVKRPASFNTANKAAKAYLQNNRVVIPKRQGTAVQQPRPLLPSPQNAQLTQKLFVPSASQRKIERPVTAHPQSRTQHYQVSGLNETPRNQKESVHKHEDDEDDEAPNRPSHSEANSEIERLGLDDEDLEKADLKSNRLAFLQSLNQYNMDKSSKGGVVPQRNNFMGGTPDNKAAAQQQQEQGHQEKRARIQSAKPQGRAQAKPKVDQAKIDKAVVKLQSFCRGYLARQEVAKVLAETPQQVYLVLIAETVKGNLENGPYSKETLYFFLMIYELDSQLIHIHIKNLENRKFHRALVEYQVANRTSKTAIINELREACERLIQHLEIHNDQIVFRDDVTDRGEKPEELYMMGQELARREAENAITQITERTEERTDESEVRPLGSKKEEEELGSEGGHRKPGHSHSHSHSGDMIEDKIEEEGLIVDDIAEEDDRYEEEGFDEEPADKKKSQKSKPKRQQQQEVEEEVEEFEEQPVVDTNDIAGLVGLKLFGGRDQEEVDKAAQTIQKHMKGKLERDKYQVAKDKKKEEEEKKRKKDAEEKRKKEEEEEEKRKKEEKEKKKKEEAEKRRKEEEERKEKEKEEEEKKKKEEEERKKKKEEEEELPNLEDPDVQNATLTIQKAYKKKEEKKKKEEEEKKKREEEEKKKKEEEEKKKKEEEELPNLEDPDVQNATLTIQKAYKKKKDKKEVKEEPKQEEKQSEGESQPESVPLPRRDTISLYRATTKDELDKAAQTIQKHIKGKLTRDTFGLTKDHKSKLVFSRATRIQGNIISFKLVEKGDEPDSYKVSCKNITTNKKFETIEIPKKSVNLKTLTVDGLVEILNVDVYAPKVTLKDKFKGKVGQKSPAYDEEFDVEEEEEVKSVEKNKKEADGTEFLASVPLYFGKEKLDSTIHYDKKKDQILVKHGFEHGKEAKSLDIPVQDLEIGTEFSKDYFISNMDIVLLSKLNYKNGNLVYDRSPMHLPASKIDMKEKKLATPNKRYNQDFDDKDLTSVREDEDNKKEGHSALQESYRSGNFEVNQEAEELIGKKGGQIRTQSIDAVGEVGHYRSGNVFAPGQVKMGKGTAEAEKQKKKEVDDELPNLEDPDVQNATLTIQKAYKNKKDKKVQEVQEKPKQKEEEKHHHKHKEEEEELPDLEDKDVQKATLTIQNAYKNKKNKQNKPAKEEPKPQLKEAEEEELPDLEDKDVQNATLTIQKAYKNKKNKQNKPAKEEPKPQLKEEEEELPDLEDKDVQNATLTIQKAYKKKKTKQNKVPEPPVEEKPVEKEDELPNLEDKDVQNATLTIQKAYKNKKNKQNKPAQEEPQHHHHHHEHHKKEEEEELPNLEDKDVQNATLTIQKAYKNKKNKQSKPVKEEPKPQEKEEEELPNLEDKDVQNATLTIQKAYKNKKNKQNKPAQEEPQHHHHQHHHHKKEEEEELPNLEDKDVQNATLTIQKAYKNKKNKQNKPPQEEPKPQPKEAEEQELPNLEDKDVQNATLTIQKAYKNKKNKQTKPVKEELVIPEPVVEKPKKKEEEEELPNLEDKDVQNATLTIQKAYKNKKNKQNQPAKEEPVIPEPVVEKPKQKEEEEELPNLEDPEVQNATLAIQKAYLKKKSKVAQPEKKPSPKKEVKPAARKDDSADDYDYEPDFSEPKTSPVKPKPQVVADKKDKKADKSENFELMNVTNEQKPEDVEKLLKEVNDEFDVFNQKDNRSDDDNKPYDEEEAPPKKKSPPKKKANDDEEDFEPIEGDF